MFLTDYFWRQGFRRRSKRINCRINSELRDRTLQHNGGIKMRKRVRRRRIGQIVGRNVNCLD